MPIFGAIDVGTNSVKLLIAERLNDGSWRAIVDRLEITRLGEGLHKGGDFAPAAVARTLEAIEAMAAEARCHQVSALAAVGTMGLRTARNADAFVQTVRERYGIDLQVISSDEEGRLAHIGALSSPALVPGSYVVFDIGGGSTEVTIGRGTQVDRRFSVDVGAVRLTEQFMLHRRAAPERLRDALDAIARRLTRLDGLPRFEVLVGVGGAITTMASVMYRMDIYDPEQVHGSTLSRDEVERQIELYRTLDGEARAEIPGLEPSRAEAILAGACVTRTVMEKLGQDALTVSDRGLRHGLLLDRFGRMD